MLYLWGPQVHVSCFFINFTFFWGRHDVKWRPCISTLRSIDIVTEYCGWSTHFGPVHNFHDANNSP